ncbi:MAG: glycosyl hydrolase 108 family protein [Desulfamplus sp.]
MLSFCVEFDDVTQFKAEWDSVRKSHYDGARLSIPWRVNDPFKKDEYEQLQRYALQYVLKNEGGLSDIVQDKGGITKFGVSLRFLLGEKIDVDGNGAINREDVLKLDIEQAKTIFKSVFWNRLFPSHRLYEAVMEPNAMVKLFDIAVHCGQSRAVKILQSAINGIMRKDTTIKFRKTFFSVSDMVDALRMPTRFITRSSIEKEFATFYIKELAVDGVFGDHTASAISAINKYVDNDKKTTELLVHLNVEYLAFLDRIIENNPTQEKFRKGWTARALLCPDFKKFKLEETAK